MIKHRKVKTPHGWVVLGSDDVPVFNTEDANVPFVALYETEAEADATVEFADSVAKTQDYTSRLREIAVELDSAKVLASNLAIVHGHHSNAADVLALIKGARDAIYVELRRFSTE